MKTIGLVAAALIVTVAIVAVRSRTPERQQDQEAGAQADSVDCKRSTNRVLSSPAS